MPAPLTALLDLLKLEQIEDTIFRGHSQDLGFGNLFGGQVLGQSLSAATQTVTVEREVHSLHAYFLRPGDPKRDIVFNVENLRDGGTFSARRITAIQKGRPILSMDASFQMPEKGFEHAPEMPQNITPPEELQNDEERAKAIIDQIPTQFRAQATKEKPIEIRPVDPVNIFAPEPLPPRQHIWFRAVGAVPDDLAVQRYLLSYASDFRLCTTALRPHAKTFLSPDMQVASLDHAMWFYRPFDFSQWLLYVMDSPSSSGGRGLNRGRIYTRDGVLVASTAQEGLIRNKQK